MAYKNLHVLFPSLAGDGHASLLTTRTFRITALAFTATTFLLISVCLPRLGHCASNNEPVVRVKQQKALVRGKSRKQVKNCISDAGAQKRLSREFQTTSSPLTSNGAIQEDPSHSGGLFITPPHTVTEEPTPEDLGASLEAMKNVPMGKPVATEISSAFGVRSDPLNRKRAFHEGLDFRGNVGDPVLATGSGMVKESGYRPDYGEYILVSHGNGIDTFFAHLSKRLVQTGESVDPGETIGLVGKTGRSTGAHLHYEVRLQGKPVNPMRFVLGTQPTKPGRKVAQLSKTGKNAAR